MGVEGSDSSPLELLRRVGESTESPVLDHGGRVVNRLGDGLMAAFLSAPEVEAGRSKGLRADGAARDLHVTPVSRV